jgi:hypothetical protein
MADDKVEVIIGAGAPPANYITAHPIANGDAIELTPPQGGCVVYFTATPKRIVPPLTPNAEGIYSLAYVAGQNYKFHFESSTEQTIQYQVGPPSTPSLTASDLNPQAHTVIIGRTTPD